jgi:hypothetical protein
MNQTFNFSRWWMLVTMHWAENRKRYLLAMLAIGGLLAAWYSFLLMMDKFGPLNLFFQYTAYYCGLFFVGCLYASTIFSGLGSKPQGLHYLSVPASHLEKLLCGIFFGVFLFFIVYTLIYYIVDIPMVQLANRIITNEHQVWPGSMQSIGKIEILNIIHNNWAPIPDREYHLFLLSYFAIQSAFLLGSVYFARYSFIKTIVGVLLFWLVFMVFVTKGVEEHLPDGWHTYNFIQWNNYKNNSAQIKLARLPLWAENSLFFLMQYSTPFIFWFIAYIRLKEKEV